MKKVFDRGLEKIWESAESWQTDGWNQIINPLIGKGMNNEAYFSARILSIWSSVSVFPWVTFPEMEPFISFGRNIESWSNIPCHILCWLFLLFLSLLCSLWRALGVCWLWWRRWVLHHTPTPASCSLVIMGVTIWIAVVKMVQMWRCKYLPPA